MVGVERKSEIQESVAPQASEWQKKCPMCGGRMDLQMNGEMWICFSCAYEETGQGKNGGKSEHAAPLASLSSDEDQESKKGSSLSKNQPPAKTKPCPACGKKMSFHESEKAWRCPHCEYERRI